MIQAMIRGDSAYLTACIVYLIVAIVIVVSLRRFTATWMHVPRIELPTKQRGGISLLRAVGGFIGIHSLQYLFVAIVAGWVFRFALGSWTIWDVLIIVGSFAFWPFQEWLLHAYLLHLKPIRLFGRTFEPVFVKTHRNHHHNPQQLGSGVVPFYFVTMYILGLPVVWHFGLPLPQAITGVSTSLLLVFIYE